MQISPMIELNLQNICSSKSNHDLVWKFAHDIRSPLSALNALKTVEDWNQQQIKNLLLMAINRINDISNDLLDDRKKESSSKNHAETFELNRSIEEIILEKKIQFSDVKGSFLFFSSECPVYIQGLKVHFQRAISNFINNSIEAARSHGVNILIGIEIYEGKASLIIEDDGQGMDQITLSKLGRESISIGLNKIKSSGGHGLGIMSSIECLSSIGARVQFESELGRGTRVLIDFS